MSLIVSPSKYQDDLFRWVREGSGSAVVTAVAGSGKTSSLIHLLSLIPEDQSVQFFAFNTAIAAELRTRVDNLARETRRSFRNVSASTFHSLGHRSVARALGIRKLDVQGRKLYQLARTTMNFRQRTLYEGFSCRLVGLAKAHGIGILIPDEDQTWQDLVDHFDLLLDAKEAMEREGIAHARTLLRLSNEQAEKEALIDFDDQLYLPILWGLELDPFDWVLVDEAQDTNEVRRAFVRKTLKPNGRVICVGDDHQSIYGFTGASVNAVGLLREEFSCVDLPLSICYRCPTAVVEKAQTLVPQIEAAPNAPAGKVEHLSIPKSREVLTKADVILCRNMAPLVELAYDNISKGTACTILGRDLAKGLTTLVEKMHAESTVMLEFRLEEYRKRESAKFYAKGQGGRADSVNDKVRCIQVVIDQLPEDKRGVGDVLEALSSLFSDGSAVLTLSTIHKAKGREWPQVAILRQDLIPSKWAKQGWQLQQEQNLLYVAWTRAREALYFLD